MHLLLQWLAACLALCCGLATAAPAITALHTQPYVYTVNPSGEIYVNYRFRAAGPTATSLRVFVHFLDANGKMVHQDDHQPPSATSQWYGDIVYERYITLPASMRSGRYRIAIGLFDPATRQRTTLGTALDPASADPSYVEADPLAWARYIVGEVYVTNKQIVAAPFVCNGNDVTEPLARALRDIGPHQVLKLPFGSCRYASLPGLNAMRLDQKAQVEVVGQGAPSTRLIATDRQRSGFIVSGSSNILLRDFRIEVDRPPGDSERTGHPDATGVYVEHSANVELRQLAIHQPLAQGISFYRSTDSRATRNFVKLAAADGIHVAGPSSNMTLDQNRLFDVGDDALSAIGYSAGDHAGANRNIVIRDNRVRFQNIQWGSGVAVEGTIGAKVLNNRIERSGSAGIRIGSIVGYIDLLGVRHLFETGGATSVEVAGNELVDVETRADLDQGAIHVAAMAADVSDVQISGNTISSTSRVGTTVDAIRLLGSVTPGRIHYVKDVQVWNNAVHNTSPGLLAAWCISRSVSTTMNLALGDGLQRQSAPNTYHATAALGARTLGSAPCTPALERP